MEHDQYKSKVYTTLTLPQSVHHRHAGDTFDPRDVTNIYEISFGRQTHPVLVCPCPLDMRHKKGSPRRQGWVSPVVTKLGVFYIAPRITKADGGYSLVLAQWKSGSKLLEHHVLVDKLPDPYKEIITVVMQPLQLLSHNGECFTHEIQFDQSPRE